MPDIDILNQMIKDTARLPLIEHYGKKQATLTEHESKNSSITIHNLPDNAVIIKADAFRSPDTVFDGSHGECKRADFIIVANTGSKKIILFIEMKTKKGPKEEIIKQLTGALCFVVYCREIGKAFWKHRNFLDGYMYRFISIGHTSIAKRKTRIDCKAGVHDRPDRMMKVDWPHHLEFHHLAGT